MCVASNIVALNCVASSVEDLVPVNREQDVEPHIGMQCDTNRA